MKVQSIDRAFDIMESLSKEPEGLSLTEISKRLELPTSTVYRLLSVLRDRNYIDKNDSTNMYKLGFGFMELSSMFLHGLELKSEANDLLRTLSRQSGQVVFLATEQDGDVVYIDKHEPFSEAKKYCFIGQRKPMHCTALGKALLTAYSDNEIRSRYQGVTLEKITPKSITDLEVLIRQIRTSREAQYSFDDEENTEGLYCVAAPIYDYRGIIIAAVSTSWDINSLEVRDREKNIDLVKNCARTISTRMGYIGG